MTQWYTSLKVDLCQEINRSCAFSRCLNGTFSCLQGNVTLRHLLNTKPPLIYIYSLYKYVFEKSM